ncbi:nucleotide-binding protein [Methanolobus sp. ZRKC3]|uniref:nucleotide-binding protein n=1 Tax=Methanolobus sp. ZRKC3 TaxID=3125786 RepID=UPI00324A8881
MEKEEKVVVILLSMIFLSLSISYLVFFETADSDISAFSSSSAPGENVFVEGSVISKRLTYSGNHLIMVIESISGPVKIFVPSDNGAGAINSQVEKDSDVHIFGVVEEYEGELEIIVQDKDDVLLS